MALESPFPPSKGRPGWFCHYRLFQSSANSDMNGVVSPAFVNTFDVAMRKIIAVAIALGAVLPTSAQSPLLFERDVRPILKAQCFECHGEGKKLKGSLDLRLRRFINA